MLETEKIKSSLFVLFSIIYSKRTIKCAKLFFPSTLGKKLWQKQALSWYSVALQWSHIWNFFWRYLFDQLYISLALLESSKSLNDRIETFASSFVSLASFSLSAREKNVQSVNNRYFKHKKVQWNKYKIFR